MKKTLSLILVLIMSLLLVACGNTTPESPVVSDGAPAVSDAAPETGIAFTVVVKTLDGTETTFEYTSEAETVGDALLEEGLIAGDVGQYGLYVTSVNGIAADWDADQTYWAFYINGEYAMTGVDSTEIVAGTTYSFVLTGPEASSDVTVLGEGETVFNFSIVDLDQNETKFEIHTNEVTVGAALLANELIEGSVGEYGLYVTTVNGVTADWDADQTYWAFYVDGEYAMTGVDQTEITAGASYSFVLTKG